MICLAAGALAASIAVNSFTLAWMHSIEKIRWEEDWRVEGKVLVLDEARILGSGAGMEPPANAVLKNGVVLRLTHSPYTRGYEICNAGRCRALADHLPGIDNIVVIELRECSQ